MIDEERKSELQNAYDVLTRHNLYRRGYCDMETVDVDPKELGVAIDTAAGAILELLRLVGIEEKYHKWYKEALYLDKVLDLCKAENKRLKNLLCAHHIKYKDKL